MPFIDRDHDGMQVVQAFGQLCKLLKLIHEVCKSVAPKNTVNKTYEVIVETMVRSHLLVARAPVALLEQLKLNPTNFLHRTSPVYV